MSVSVSSPMDSLGRAEEECACLDTVAVVLAGGEGSRLRPLTDQQCKPALPFAGAARIVDFVIANLANSGIRRIIVLAQYKPDTLVEHLHRHWTPLFAATGRILRIVLPRSEAPADRFAGTADAVAKAREHWSRLAPSWVAVFAADHIYRMDVAQMIHAHRRSGAGITVAALPVPLAEARELGVLRTEAGGRIIGFQEKPDRPVPMPRDPALAYASMGNYVFDAQVLRNVLWRAEREGHVDFGRDVLPAAIHRERAFAYDFTTNRIPGVANPAPYWRDVGTLASLELARAEIGSLDAPIRIEEPVWPLRPLAPDARNLPPVRGRPGRNGSGRGIEAPVLAGQDDG